MSYIVNFKEVETTLLEDSPVKEVLAGLRCHRLHRGRVALHQPLQPADLEGAGAGLPRPRTRQWGQVVG